MARKAGPGNGAGDAPEGRADLTPEEAGIVPEARLSEEVPEARLSEEPEAGAGLRPDEVGRDARIESLSDEGAAALPPGAIPVDDRIAVGGEPEAQALPGSPEPVIAEDWRSLSSAEEGRVAAPDLGETLSSEPSYRPAADPDRPGERSAPDPLRLTTPVEADELGASGPFGGPAPLRDPLPPPAAPRRRGAFGTLLLGGMIAAALGFGAAWLAQDRLGLFPARLPADIEQRLAALEAHPAPEAGHVQGLADRVAQVETRLAALEQAPAPSAAAVDIDPLRQELSKGIQDAQARVGELESRIAALEARPVPSTGGEAPLGGIAPSAGPAVQPAPAVDAAGLRQDILGALEPRVAQTEAGLEELRTALTDARTNLDALSKRLDEAEAQSASAAQEAQAAAASLADAQARAATAETQSRASAALGDVQGAIDTGQPFEAALSSLSAAGVTVPDALTQAAAEGVPTLSELRQTFPEAARAGLAAAREQGLLNDGGGVMGFLRDQFSVRSVAPREGGDPDAVLSRAEAQLGEGHLDAVLTEIDSLPEPVRAAMADWIAQARARAHVEAALAGLRDATPTAPDAPPAD